MFLRQHMCFIYIEKKKINTRNNDKYIIWEEIKKFLIIHVI